MPCNDTIEEYLLPQIEALLAGTLALMTALAQANAQCTHRELMAAKVRDNLTQLAKHPQLSGTLRTVLARMVGQWAPVAVPVRERAAWHAGTATMQ